MPALTRSVQALSADQTKQQLMDLTGQLSKLSDEVKELIAIE